MASNSFRTCTGQRGGAADAQPQRQRHRDGRIDHAPVELGYSRQNRRLALQDLLQNVAHRVEGFNQDNRAAHQQGQQQSDCEHVAVEQGQQHHKTVQLDRLQHDPAALDIVQQVAVREHCALGTPGCPGGVNEDRQISSLGIGPVGRRVNLAVAVPGGKRAQFLDSKQMQTWSGGQSARACAPSSASVISTSMPASFRI